MVQVTHGVIQRFSNDNPANLCLFCNSALKREEMGCVRKNTARLRESGVRKVAVIHLLKELLLQVIRFAVRHDL